MGGVIEGLTEKIVENTLGTEDESAEEKTRFTNGHERPALAHSNPIRNAWEGKTSELCLDIVRMEKRRQRRQGTIENLH